MALTFNGTSQSIYLTTATTAPASSAEIKTWPVSLSCWFNVPAFGTPPAKNILIASDCTVSLTNNWLMLYLSGNRPTMITGTSAAQLITASTVTVTANTWYHAVMVTTSSTSRVIYVNGVATSDLVSSISYPIGQNNICVAANFNSSLIEQNYLAGTIAYPAIWNIGLTQADVTALYNSGSGLDPRTIQPAKLLTLMRFNAINTYQDDVSLNVWTVQGSPTQVADPFAIGVASPVLSVQGASLVTATTATLNGTLIFTRGATPTVEGFNYGTTTGYGTDTSTTGTYAPGAFSLPITGLTPSTIYHFRSFSTNSSGTGVSIDGYFTTKATGIPPGTPTPFHERLGYSCSFDQQGASPNWNPPKLMPLIAASGAMWIRDVVNWSQFEPSPGTYFMHPVKSAWMQLIHTLGMKFCGVILYPPLFYAGNTKISQNEVWPLPEFAAFCAWFANTGLVDVIELVNEANNVPQFGPPLQGGTLANLDLLVQMSVMARAAVRATGSTVPVISLDEQGDEITYMLRNNPLIDGVVYHPYDRNDSCPESTFETPFFDYANWVRNVQAVTTIPIWETEFNGDNNTKKFGEYSMGLWLARRYLLSWWLGVPHTFVYNFSDPSLQTLTDYAYNPRQQYWITQRTLLALQSVNTTGQFVTVTNMTGGFSAPDIMSTVFCSTTSTVASVWLGHKSTTYAGSLIVGSGTATISFRCINTHVTDSVVDSMSGKYTPLSAYSPTLSAKVMTLQNYPISDTPQYITVSGVSQPSAPLVATYLVTNVTFSTATLTGGITFDGGSSSTIQGFHYGPTTAYGGTVQVTAGLDTGNFALNVSSLSPNTTYHFQSFATNGNGTGTSDDATFLTAMVVAGPPGGGGGGVRAPGTLTENDILLQSIIGENEQQVLDNLGGGPDPLTHGPQQGNTVPPEMQNEYLKAFLQVDYTYRI